ncbi:hypothetical protein [Nocardia gipuzkoensis]|uniref:hypothetical protein n=1 Tax=Nocardia gipuzkoensis TaxID=2749991 RepID=UPI00237DBC88|nr:hypothetical protein [Nocardia gipuzkoensis]MDE1673833.1 hypothetical protein [Nocardia gipuzkoensis]
MTIIYTREAVEAAQEMRDACQGLAAAVPRDLDTYRAAWDRHILAESAWAHMWPAGHIPHTLDVIASAYDHPNQLRESLCAGVFRTRDDRFTASPYLPGRDKAGKWAVEYQPTNCTEVVTVDTDDLAHAQLIVDLITWAETDGARNGED